MADAADRTTTFDVLVTVAGVSLHDSRVDRGDQIYGPFQVLLRHAGFQRLLDATITSGLTPAT